MSSSTSSSETGGGLLLALGLAGVVIAAVELGSLMLAPADSERFYPPDRVPLLEESITQWQIHHLLHAVGPQDVLLLGDSSCLMGTRPLQMMEQTGLDVWSAATIGSLGVRAHVRTLDLFVRRSGVPRLVVYHTNLHALVTQLRALRQTRRFDHFPGWVDRVEGMDETPRLPSLRLRDRLQERIVHATVRPPFDEVPRTPYGSDADVRDELLRKRGVMTQAVGQKLEGPMELRGILQDAAKAELERLFERAEKYGFTLVVVMGPFPDVTDTPRTRLTLETLQKNLRELAEPFSNVHVAEPFIRFYATDQFGTLAHLLETGAERNTNELIAILREGGHLPADAAAP